MKDVIVIGGGVAGLIAARACARVGLNVTVLETSAVVGGAVASHAVAGLTLDSGAESFAVRKNAVREFIDLLGLSDQIITPNPAGAWLHLPSLKSPGVAVSVPLPQAGVLGIPGSPLATDVRRVIGWTGSLRGYLDRLMPVLTIGREHSLGELVQKRMGRRVLERLVEPVAGGVYSTSAIDLEVDVVAPGLNSALTTTGSLSGAVLSMRSAAPAGSAVAGLQGGMSTLVDALVADLTHFGVEIRTGTRVAGLEVDSSDDASAGIDGESDAETSWTVTVEPGLAADDSTEVPAPETLQARFIVLATPGAESLRLLADLGSTQAALSDLDWPAATAVELATLVIDAPELDLHPRGTGALVGAGTPGVTAKALTHVSAKWSWLAEAAGAGRHVLRLSYGRAGQASPVVNLTDDELQALALADAEAILGVSLDPAAVVGFARTYWSDALSPATIGAPARVQDVRDAVAATPNLEVTGAWLAGTGLASVIPDALAAAARIRQQAVGLPL